MGGNGGIEDETNLASWNRSRTRYWIARDLDDWIRRGRVVSYWHIRWSCHARSLWKSPCQVSSNNTMSVLTTFWWLLCVHAITDYVLQPEWMGRHKGAFLEPPHHT